MTDKTLPLVTIAIPTYNRANGYLRNAIECALGQTYQEVEVVISDNCSSDNTEEVVKGFHDPRIRYFRQSTNIGANNNFNFCLEKAQGDYFLLLHDDDLIDSDFIDVCMKAADYKIGVGLIRTGTRVTDAEGQAIRLCPNMASGFTTDELFRGWFTNKTTFYLCSTLFNTKRLREIGGFKSKHNLFQDVMAELRLAAKFGRADVADIKAGFRTHPGEITYSVKVGQWCEDSHMLLDLMCDLASKENKHLIKKEGRRFFAQLNYRRASAVKAPIKRVIAYGVVFQSFRYRYLPSAHHFLSPVYNMLNDTPLYKGLQSIKRMMVGSREQGKSLE